MAVRFTHGLALEGGTWPSWANRVRGVVVAITRGQIAALVLHLRSSFYV